MSLANDFKAIAELDLDPIKIKLMHKESGEGWTREYASAIEFEYRRFLYLMKKFPTAGAAPFFDVDIFWHYHILDTTKYMADCDSVFGYYLHHFPYLGLRGDDDLQAHHDAGRRMQQLYEENFGEPFTLSCEAFDTEGADDSSVTMRPAMKTAWSVVPTSASSSLRPAMKTAWSVVPTSATFSLRPAMKTALSWVIEPQPERTSLDTTSRPVTKTPFSYVPASSSMQPTYSRPSLPIN